MRVNRIFHSLQGEGVFTGVPTVFIRLQGCNLRCTYCDTLYAQSSRGGKEMTVSQVRERMYVYGKALWGFCITGGEPLLQPEAVEELMTRLRSGPWKVEIETSGSIDPPEWFKLVDSWSVDVKCPSSGPSYGTFRPKWLSKLRLQDQLKFVVGTGKDLGFVRGFLNDTHLRPTVLMSPATGALIDEKRDTIEEYWSREWLQEVAEFCKEVNARFSLQVHKVVWGNEKGV